MDLEGENLASSLEGALSLGSGQNYPGNEA